jgi:hypothetical protein
VNEDFTINKIKIEKMNLIKSVLLIGFGIANVLCLSAQPWSTSSNDIYNSNSGNVGIGTSSPGALLHVVNTSASTTALRLRMASSQTADPFQIYDASNNKIAVITKDGYFNFIELGSYYPSTPAALLDIQSQTADFLRFYNAGTGGVVMKVGLNGPIWHGYNATYDAGNNRLNAGSVYTSGDNVFPSISASTGTADLRLNRDGFSAGNVLVGFDASQGSGLRLQVKGIAYVNDGIALGTTTIPSGYKLAVVGNINTDGMAVGTTTLPTGYKLAVGGYIITEKVRVKLLSSGWPDYVFGEKYLLPGLKETEQYIKQNNHLPGVPTAAEIEKDGLDLGDGQALLLKKIEELTLHLIEMDKKIDKLAQENIELKKELGLRSKNKKISLYK